MTDEYQREMEEQERRYRVARMEEYEQEQKIQDELRNMKYQQWLKSRNHRGVCII